MGDFKYRDYQLDLIEKGLLVIKHSRFVYLSLEVRVGKTFVSIGICDSLEGVNNVLFITKKKAIKSIEESISLIGTKLNVVVINYESLHKIDECDWDVVVCDEAHSMGAFPKPSKRAKDIKALVSKHNPYVILLSGTPTPESYSQMYHQVYGIRNNPFSSFKNFYRFSDVYVDVKERYLSHGKIKDYSGGMEEILHVMKPYMISFTQKQAGFTSSVDEEVLTVEMSKLTYNMCDVLKRDLVISGSEEVVLADTAVKLMSKLHQMFSGTVKFESGNSMTLDTSKALFIKERFKGKKIAIFYKFKQEYKLLKQEFGDLLCDDISVFNEDPHKNIALQIVSGREGISLRNAEYIIYFNIDFSATSYWQSRDRMTTIDRSFNKVFWIFSKGGIEHKIYKAVINKKNYTLSHFKKDFL